ncbi:enoyl-CoA hydratase/isomerase family protein [Arthrobacter sp. NPDC080031]|uniref:enoyl-CoA hydratase/isomerase family protein n=1 Tax=Arthrobacter sp. NPDC080031 TaxID=3155918 RepID=UPI00344DCBDD
MTESESALTVTKREGYEIWTMQLAPVNAINPELLTELRAAIAAASADPEVSAVVLASSLRVFSAGADAAWMAAMVQENGTGGLLEAFNTTMDDFREVCMEIRRMPALVIAALDGHVVAGGLELAAACDLRFCAANDKIQLSVPEMDLFGAMPTGGGGAQFLTRLCGASRALDLILDAKPVNPGRALTVGLVDRLIDDGTAQEAAERFAAEVARKAGRIGVHAAKRSVHIGSELPLEAALAFDQSVHWDAMRRGNFIPGVEAFVAKYGVSRS